MTESGLILGTPHYMAHEQIYGERDVDARADVWALGVVTCECLSGERPVSGNRSGRSSAPCSGARSSISRSASPRCRHRS